MQSHIFITELQYQYLNYITGNTSIVQILKKIHNTGTNCYTSDRQVQEILLSQSRMMWSTFFFNELIEFYLHTLKLGSSSSLHFWPSFTPEDYWQSAVLNLVNT